MLIMPSDRALDEACLWNAREGRVYQHRAPRWKEIRLNQRVRQPDRRTNRPAYRGGPTIAYKDTQAEMQAYSRYVRMYVHYTHKHTCKYISACLYFFTNVRMHVSMYDCIPNQMYLWIICVRIRSHTVRHTGRQTYSHIYVEIVCGSIHTDKNTHWLYNYTKWQT